MISEVILAEWLNALRFKSSGGHEFRREIAGGLRIVVDTAKGAIRYPEDIKLASRTSSNLSQVENLVVLDCVIRLLEDGYPASAITLEPTWKLGHGASGGRADILVRDRLGSAYLLIECKTAGPEYAKEWEKTKSGTGQLFSYAQQETSLKFLALYASRPHKGQVSVQFQLISHLDDEVVLSQNSDLRSYRGAQSVEERYRAWKETYAQFSTTWGMFSGRGVPYQIGQTPRTVSDLLDLTEADRTRKSGEFATILRKYNISGRENAFDVLVNLFVAKLTDELENPDDLRFTWRGSSVETPYDLVERLEILYRVGMKRFLDEEVAYIASDDLDQAMRFIKSTPDAAKVEIAELFKRQKFYSRSNFGFLDVHNEDLFLSNAAVLIEMVDMWQKSRISVAGNRSSTQALGDMFEIFLDEGVKQNEGQYFTPWTVCDFIIDCIPVEPQEAPRVLDFACGAGHFLTQYYNKRIAANDDEALRERATSNLFGIEKEYRLSKVAKVASAMYGALTSNILHRDSLAKSTFNREGLSEKFDILLSNPPYSVDGFLTQLDDKSRESLDLSAVVANPTKFDQIEDAFLQRAVEVVAPGGYAALIFPESFYDKDSASSNLTREKLFSYFHLRALAKLPSGTFSSTGTSTWIAYLRRRAEGPSDSAQIAARVAAIFAQGKDAIYDPVYGDNPIVMAYLEKFELTEAALLALIGRDYEYAFAEDAAFADALRSRADRWVETQRQAGQTVTLGEARRAVLPQFVEDAVEEHKDRLRKFWLLSTNGDCLFVVPDDAVGSKKDVADKYLGYKWSKRRGHAGIHLIGSEDERRSVPLFPSEGNPVAAAISAYLSPGDAGIDAATLQEQYLGRAKFEVRPPVDLVSWPVIDSPLAIDLSPIVDISEISKFDVDYIGNLLDVRYGRGLPEHMRNADGEVPVFGSPGPVGFHDEALFNEPGVVVGRKGSAGLASLALGPSYPIDTAYFVRPRDDSALLVEFLYLVIDHHAFPAGGSGVPSLPKGKLERYQIPLPPVEKQREIVEVVFEKEGSEPTDPRSVKAAKNAEFRWKYLTEELGW